MRPFVIRWLVISLAAGVVLALLGSGGSGQWALLGAALLLGFAQALVRPLALRFARGWFGPAALLVILALSALFFLGLGTSVPPYQFPHLQGALAGGAIVSAVSWPLNFYFRSSDGHVHSVTHPTE